MQRRSRFALTGVAVAAVVAFVAAERLSRTTAHAGQRIYETACASCHEVGAHGAPRAGVAAEWTPRMSAGPARLYDVALRGKVSGDRIMPPRGGNPALSDADVRAAVDYLLSRSK